MMDKKGILYIPKNILVDSGLAASFVAKFCLFFALTLFFTIAIGKLLKYIFKIPVIAGQIIAGIILGPSILNIAGWNIFSDNLILSINYYDLAITSSDIFVYVILLISAGFTVSYLLWLAGYETDISEMIKVGPAASLAGFLGAIVPIFLVALTILFCIGKCSLAAAIGVGLIFSATSVSIPVAMLVSQKKMHLRSSKATLGAAIIDDILAIMFLSVFIILMQSGVFGVCDILENSLHASSITLAIAKIIFSFAVFIVVGLFITPILMRWLNYNKFVTLIAPVAFCFMLFYFSFSELIGGLAGITGAYFAGLFQKRVDEHHQSEATLSPFITSIFVPIFLASVGLQVDVTVLTFNEWLIALLLLVVAIISKIFGVYLATFISNLFFEKEKWSMFESYIFGSSMVARGEVGLVAATLLRSIDIINYPIYIISVVVIILTTIATPIMLAIGFNMKKGD